MKLWTDWEIIRRQVTVCGRVADGSGKPVEGGRVEITSMSEVIGSGPVAAVDPASAGTGGLGTGVESVCSAQDGIFFFMDLPLGEYMVSVLNPFSGARDERNISVSLDKKRHIRMVQADFILRS